MELSSDCLKSLCSIGVAAGAIGLGLAGMNIAAGSVELLTNSGELALNVRDGQQDVLKKIRKKVRKAIEKNYRSWLRAEISDNDLKSQTVVAAFAQLDDAIYRVQPTVQDMIAAGHKTEVFVATLHRRLPASSLFKTEVLATKIFTVMIAGIHGLARSDEALKATFDTLSFEKIFDQFDEAQADRDKKERAAIERDNAAMALQEKVLDDLHTRYGVPIERLSRLFKEAKHAFPDGNYAEAVEKAIDDLISRGNEPVALLNSGEDIVRVIEQARLLMREADDEGAVALLQAARDEQKQLALRHNLDAARLANEEAEVHKTMYRWDRAIAVFKDAIALDNTDAWPWFEIGDICILRGQLTSALNAYKEGESCAESNGNIRDLSVSYNKIGDVEVASGRLDEARKAFRQGLDIAEQLARQDSTNTEWQRDLIVSNVKLAGLGDGAKEHYQAALDIALRLKADGRLQPVDDWMIGELEERLAGA